MSGGQVGDIPGPMRLQIQRIFVQLIWSLVAVAAAWGTTEVLYRVYPPLRGHGHYTFFLAAIAIAIAIAAWRGGILCALFTVVMSSLVVAWLMPPANSFRINNPEDIVRLALFGGLGLLISYLHYTRHRAEESFKESERRSSILPGFLRRRVLGRQREERNLLEITQPSGSLWPN